MSWFEKALSQTLFKTKWFSGKILSSQFIENKRIPTARVSRKDDQTLVEYNPDYFRTLTHDLRASALIHEVLHVMMKHHIRITDFLKSYPECPPDLIQYAADIEVNSMLIDMKMPIAEDWRYESKYHGVPFEGILIELLQKKSGASESYGTGSDDTSDNESSTDEGADNQGQDQEQESSTGESGRSSGDAENRDGEDSMGDGQADNRPQKGDSGHNQSKPIDRYSTGSAPADIVPFQAETKSDMKQEAQTCDRSFVAVCVQAQLAGELPAAMKRYLDTLIEPELDWVELLRDYMDSFKPESRTWRRPKELYNFLLPTWDGQTVGEMIIAIDASGSVTPDELRKFGSEALYCAEEIKPEKLHILWFDTQVYPEVYEEGEIPTADELKPRGGGGTNYRPVFEYIEKKCDDPMVLVILTDGECGSYPYKEPEYPTLWVITKKRSRYYSEPPFGDIIEIK